MAGKTVGAAAFSVAIFLGIQKKQLCHSPSGTLYPHKTGHQPCCRHRQFKKKNL
jgi:hypothetical protein